MPQATAKRMAELLIEDHADNESFDVDFLDGPFTELMVEALESLGCEVKRIGPGTRLSVAKPSEAKTESVGRGGLV
jgi:hypothetical protein